MDWAELGKSNMFHSMILHLQTRDFNWPDIHRYIERTNYHVTMSER
jgi:hypothetical protein